MRDEAVSKLGLSLMEFYDRTIFELSIELEGYNSRWEEQWRHTRLICTFFYNSNPGEEGPKLPYQILPLPSEAVQVALDDYANSIAFEHMMGAENKKSNG